MGTEILKSFGTLQSELEQAKSSLKGVDENIKRLIGRDPSDLPARLPPLKRNTAQEDRPPRPERPSRIVRIGRPELEEPAPKRRPGLSVFKRLSDRPVSNNYKDEIPNKQMISKVIVTPKEVPSRQEALAAQKRDEKSKARDKRMFGALLGTLQKFRQEETKLKQREDKRAQLEKKIEEHEIKEKEEIKKERQELFFNRKKKQAEIKMIELKMMRMRDYAGWEERQKPRMNFIRTKAKPHIHYLPRRLNDTTKAILEENKKELQKMIDDKKQEVCEELKRIEERMKRNFEDKVATKDDKSDHEDEDDDNDDINENKVRVENGTAEQDGQSKPDENLFQSLAENENMNDKGEHEIADISDGAGAGAVTKEDKIEENGNKSESKEVSELLVGDTITNISLLPPRGDVTETIQSVDTFEGSVNNADSTIDNGDSNLITRDDSNLNHAGTIEEVVRQEFA